MTEHDCEKCHDKPGSNSAGDKGCTCPVMDNGRGHAELLWASGDCPMHGGKAL